jgi:hypothetical protein
MALVRQIHCCFLLRLRKSFELAAGGVLCARNFGKGARCLIREIACYFAEGTLDGICNALPPDHGFFPSVHKGSTPCN